ncbi:MAG TPA: hypothetical protein VE666_18430 [Mycobacterium sp.]|nr:hypothetical protein [Mycobacterium sp.]
MTRRDRRIKSHSRRLRLGNPPHTWQDFCAKGRNLLIDGGLVDPLSQTAAVSSSYVGIERVTWIPPLRRSSAPFQS